MRLLAVLAFAAVVAAQLVACTVEPLTGCQSDEDCRFGRVCQAGACVNPGANQPQADLGVGDAAVPDQSPGQGFLVFDREQLDLGVMAPGTVQSVTLQVTNAGSATVMLGDAFFVEGLFEASVTGSLILEPDASTSIQVEAAVPADAPPGSQLADLLEVESDAPNQAQLLVVAQVAAAGEVCLEASGEDNVVVTVGGATELEVNLFNCGEVPVRLNFIELIHDGQNASIGIANAPPNDAAVAVGTSRRVTINVRGLAVGNTAGELSVLYAGGRQLEFEFGVNVIAGDGCSGTLSAQADGDGPSSIGESIQVQIGHQILFAALEAGATLLDLEVLDAPGLSQELVGIDSPGVWKLIPDVLGEYRVRGEIGFQNGCIDQVEMAVSSILDDAQLVVWVTWPEPNSAGPYLDMDLYVAELAEGGYFWQTPGLYVGPGAPTADFGVEGPLDDPEFNRDYNHVAGFGPERVRFDGYSSGIVGIGVHRFDNQFSPSAVSAQVRVQIYLFAELAFDGQADLGVDEFWFVGQYDAERDLTIVDQLYDGLPDQTDPP